ncbi:MAG: AI-2E family transporter [Gemmatimonadota bacterium]
MTSGSGKGNGPSASAGVAGAAVVVLFGFLLYSLWGVLNPFILFLALIPALLPFHRSSWFWAVLGSAGGLTIFWLFSELGFLLAPFVLALVLAYVLNPAVDWIARRDPLARLDQGDSDRRMGRTVAIVVLALPLIGAIAGGTLWGLPFIGQQVNELLRSAPTFLDRVAGLLMDLEETLLSLRLPGVDGSLWVERIRGLDEAAVVSFLEERGQALVRSIWEGALGVGRGIGSFLSVLGYLVLTPVLAFYLLRDYGRLRGAVDALIPRDREEVREFLREYDVLLSAYLRGQLLVAVCVGTLTGFGLWITNFPYAILLGVLVAVLGLVPYLGLLLSLIPAVAIAFASGAVGVSLLKVAFVFGITQTLEGTVISPRILGDSTGLHPVWILLAISLGGFFFGFVGLLIAVPAAVGIKLLAVQAAGRYRGTEFFNGGRAPTGSEGESSA